MDDKFKELEDLEALLISSGWELFRKHASTEWGSAAYRRKVQQILNKLEASQTNEAAHLVLQLEAAAREVERLFEWPIDRVRQLKAMKEREREAAR